MLSIRILLLAAALAAAGCARTADPVVASEHCYAEREDIMLLPTYVYCGNNCSTIVMVPTPVSTCVAAAVVVEPNPEYKAPRS